MSLLFFVAFLASVFQLLVAELIDEMIPGISGVANNHPASIAAAGTVGTIVAVFVAKCRQGILRIHHRVVRIDIERLENVEAVLMEGFLQGGKKLDVVVLLLMMVLLLLLVL